MVRLSARTLLLRDIAIPHYAGADLLAESWEEIGVSVRQNRRIIWDWQKVIDAHDFDIALDFSATSMTTQPSN
jgi:hypothetical protein